MSLAGLVVSSLAGALTALTLSLSPNPYAASEIIFWMMGSLADRGFGQLQVAITLMLPGWLLMLSCARGLDALALGEDGAASLGINTLALRLRAVTGVALAVGAAVSVSGVIGFIGLVVPHLLRPLVGHQPGRLLWVSALGGGCLLLATDISLRLLPTTSELKIGVVTALFGAPFFLVLLHRLRRGIT
jgi:iron complex transport system permease protein